MEITHEQLQDLLAAYDVTRQRTAGGWPLDKRETFQAFVLMGLASRLQPAAVHDSKARAGLVKLAGEMADLALAENAERNKP